MYFDILILFIYKDKFLNYLPYFRYKIDINKLNIFNLF